MLLSRFYLPTKRSAAKQDSLNAYLLSKAGYINQAAAGVYALLPLATRTTQKIEAVIRSEMTNLGGSEAVFSALQPKSIWEKSGRWQDANFRQIVYFDEKAEMTFGATHEEPMAIAIKESVQSYRDLPILLYQFQTKFRKELRAKSGLLRGREFRMKDLYSFHRDQTSHREFYEQAAEAYLRIFQKLGLEAYRVKAGGGVFTDLLTDEFQVICSSGEDEILVNHQTKTGYNREIEAQLKTKEKNDFERVKAIEVGNIFSLGTKYSAPFDLSFLNRSGQKELVVMGSYGIGVTRLLGTLAELYNDEHGLKLPHQVAPFDVYLIDLTDSDYGAQLEIELTKKGFDVLFDDREEGAGAKMVDADLIGLPFRLLYSQKTAQEGKVEVKERASGHVELVTREKLASFLGRKLS